jgi:hypothetical protein
MHALLTPDISFGEKIIRTTVVYAFLLIGLRLAGKRELSQLNPFDLVVLLLLSNTVQNAIIGNDNSLIGGSRARPRSSNQRHRRPRPVPIGKLDRLEESPRRSFTRAVSFASTSIAR